MLVQGLRDGLHVPPLVEAGWKAAELKEEGKAQLVHAPKVDKAAAQVLWDAWTAEDWTRRVRALGSVWANAVVGTGKHKGHARRVLFLDAEAVADEGVSHEALFKTVFKDEEQQKCTVEVAAEDGSGSCLVRLPLGGWVRVGRVKVEGNTEQDAAVALRAFRET